MSINTNLINQSKSVQRDLQEKYLSTPKEINSLLRVFHQCLKQNEITTTIGRSSSGSTGFTFFCSFPSTAVPKETKRHPINFVIKWQPENLCKIEMMGAFIFQSLQFPAPNILSGSNTESTALIPFAAKEVPSIAQLSDHSIIVMPQLHANTFEGAVKNDALKQLSQSDLKKLGFLFGQIALIDMAIGNDDRFIRFQPGYEETIPFSSSFNSGNIMIEFDEDSLQNVFPIDNCLASSLVERKSSVDDVDDFELSMFDDDTETTTFSSPPLEIIKKEDLDKNSEVYNKIFINLIEHLQDVALHIRENIRREISQTGSQIEDYETFINLLPESLEAGMRDSIQKIKTTKTSLLPTQENLDSNVKRMLKLTEENFEFLKNKQ